MTALTRSILNQLNALLEHNLTQLDLLSYARRYEPSEISEILEEIKATDVEIKNLRLALDAPSV